LSLGEPCTGEMFRAKLFLLFILSTGQLTSSFPSLSSQLEGQQSSYNRAASKLVKALKYLFDLQRNATFLTRAETNETESEYIGNNSTTSHNNETDFLTLYPTKLMLIRPIVELKAPDYNESALDFDIWNTTSNISALNLKDLMINKTMSPVQKMHSIISKLLDQSDAGKALQVDVAFFDQICKLAQPAKQCGKNCNRTEVEKPTGKASKTNSLVQYLCVDRFQTVKNNVPCLQNLLRNRGKFCVTKCRKAESKKQDSTQVFLLSRHNFDAKNDLTKSMCKYTKCMAACFVPKIGEQCGRDVAEITKEAVKMGLSAFQDVFEFIDDGEKACEKTTYSILVRMSKCYRKRKATYCHPNWILDERSFTSGRFVLIFVRELEIEFFYMESLPLCMSADEEHRLREILQQADAFRKREEIDLMRQPLESQLMKFTNAFQGWHNRWCVLDPNKGQLRYYLKSECKNQKPRGVLSLVNAEINPSEEDSLIFSVTPAAGETYKFRAFDIKQKQQWVNRLRTVAADHTERKIKNLKSQAVQKYLTRSIDELPRTVVDNVPVYQDCLAVKSYLQSLLDNLNECFEALKTVEQGVVSSLYAEVSTNGDGSSVDDQQSVVVESNDSYDEEEEQVDDALPVPLPVSSESNSSTINSSSSSSSSSSYGSSVQRRGQKPKKKDTLLTVTSHLKLGTDMTKVALPSVCMRGYSLLEMYSNFFSNLSYFFDIAEKRTADERLISILKWYLSAFYFAFGDDVSHKPYNPVQGETFTCSWVQSIEDTNYRRRRIRFHAEQISHRPPSTAIFASSSSGNLFFNATICHKATFMGNSISVTCFGDAKLAVSTSDVGDGSSKRWEVYQIGFPSLLARSILTEPWMELGGKFQISCQQTEMSAAVTFHTKPFYFSKLNRVTVEAKTASGHAFCRMQGDWRYAIHIELQNGSTEMIDVPSIAKAIRLIRPLEKQAENESRVVWKNVTDCLRNGDLTAADEAKVAVEQLNRNKPASNKYSAFKPLVDSTFFIHKEMPMDAMETEKLLCEYNKEVRKEERSGGMKQRLSNGADEKEKHIRIQDIDVYFNNAEKQLKRAQVISESPLLLQPYVSKCLEKAKPLFWNIKRTADQAVVYFDYFKAVAEYNYAYFVKEDQTALPKTVAIALAAMGGFLMGFRKGDKSSMVSYSFLATSLAAMFCYPQPVVELIQHGPKKLLQYRWNDHSTSALPQSWSSSSSSSANSTSTASDSRDHDMYTTRSDRIA
ncbi:Oxysterol-binding protein-related protein 11, partial [Trichinella pseudospiralis]